MIKFLELVGRAWGPCPICKKRHNPRTPCQ